MEPYKKYYPAAFAVIAIIFLWTTFLSVRETEFVLITQFGRPIRTITEAGLHAKWFFQTSIFFDRRPAGLEDARLRGDGIGVHLEHAHLERPD